MGYFMSHSAKTSLYQTPTIEVIKRLYQNTEIDIHTGKDITRPTVVSRRPRRVGGQFISSHSTYILTTFDDDGKKMLNPGQD